MKATFDNFLNSSDFSPQSRRAFRSDLRNFAGWFETKNKERFSLHRITTCDVVDFRNHLQKIEKKAVATINRNLVTVRRFLDWAAEQGLIPSNPAKKVKEIRKQSLAPKGLESAQVRRLLREVELRQDIRSAAIFHVFLFTGCRVGDLVNIDLEDLNITERSGAIILRQSKGNKYRSVPLPLSARKAVSVYLQARPTSSSTRLFIGERGPLSDRGVRSLCKKYAVICGFYIHPHLLRHTMAHKFLADSGNDLISLAQILGHENLNTTARYTKRTEEQLGDAAEKMEY